MIVVLDHTWMPKGGEQRDRAHEGLDEPTEIGGDRRLVHALCKGRGHHGLRGRDADHLDS